MVLGRERAHPEQPLGPVVTAMKVHGLTIPECQECGACCAGWEVDLFSSDLVNIERAEKRLGKTLMREVSRGDTVMAATGPRLRCAALKGRIGKDTACAIYKDRPDVCRAFRRGGDQCITALVRARREGWMKLTQEPYEPDLV